MSRFLSHDPSNDAPQLFVHSLRPQWGAGLLTRERRHRRTLQFEDGRVRKFKEGFYHLLEPMEEGEAATATLAEALERKFLDSMADEQEMEKESGTPLMSLPDQVRVFRHRFPDGFQDPEYINLVREAEDGKPRKRLRDPAIARARKLLAEDRLRGFMEEGEPKKVLTACLKVLRKTNLVSPSKVVQPLSKMPDKHIERFATALIDLLYGEGDQRPRFREWVLALDGGGKVRVTWPMATALPALVHPEREVAVRWRVFRAQAHEVSPGLFVRRVPTPAGYEQARAIARATWEQLKEEGLEPRDLLDVREFIWETLRPKGQQIQANL